jgi:hypothetical protein
MDQLFLAYGIGRTLLTQACPRPDSKQFAQHGTSLLGSSSFSAMSNDQDTE